jgi:predicted GIY-YIG superfamily endonuclease
VTQRTSLYRFFDASGSLLYLGIAGDPDLRATQHARDAAATWYPLVSERTVAWFASRGEAEAAEKEAIAAERPRFNIKDATHTGSEAWAAHRDRQRRKRLARTVRVPVGLPAEAARAIREAMTDDELACLMDAFREMGADKLMVPELKYHLGLIDEHGRSAARSRTRKISGYDPDRHRH